MSESYKGPPPPIIQVKQRLYNKDRGYKTQLTAAIALHHIHLCRSSDAALALSFPSTMHIYADPDQ